MPKRSKIRKDGEKTNVNFVKPVRFFAASGSGPESKNKA